MDQAEETIDMEDYGDNAVPLLTMETKLVTDKDNTDEIIALLAGRRSFELNSCRLATFAYSNKLKAK